MLLLRSTYVVPVCRAYNLMFDYHLSIWNEIYIIIECIRIENKEKLENLFDLLNTIYIYLSESLIASFQFT